MSVGAIEAIRGVLTPEAMALLGSGRAAPGRWTPTVDEMPLVDELVWEGLTRRVDGTAEVVEPTAAGLFVASVLRTAGVLGDGRRTLASLSAELEARTGIPLAALRSRRRDPVASRGRALLALLARTELHRSNGEVGSWLHADASSAPEMRRRAEAMIAAEPEVAALVAGLRTWLAGGEA